MSPSNSTNKLSLHVSFGIDVKGIESLSALDLDEEDVVEEICRAAQNRLDSILDAAKRRIEYIVILERDEELAAFEKRLGQPIVRASVYGDINNISNAQELPRPTFFGDDPRRPVHMRGSRIVRRARYEAMRDFHHALGRRYLRRIKYTCFRSRQFCKDMGELDAALIRKHPLGSRKVGCNAAFWTDWDNGSFWLHGERAEGVAYKERAQIKYMLKLEERLGKLIEKERAA